MLCPPCTGQAFSGNCRGIFHRTLYFIPAGEGTAIYNHFMAACIQAGAIPDGQVSPSLMVRSFCNSTVPYTVRYCRQRRCRHWCRYRNQQRFDH